jgi:hypothetical protein
MPFGKANSIKAITIAPRAHVGTRKKRLTTRSRIPFQHPTQFQSSNRPRPRRRRQNVMPAFPPIADIVRIRLGSGNRHSRKQKFPTTPEPPAPLSVCGRPLSDRYVALINLAPTSLSCRQITLYVPFLKGPSPARSSTNSSGTSNPLP